MDWRRFWRDATAATLAAALFVAAAIVVVDPYDNIFFSPPLERAPVASNQRYSYPALARAPRFDSAVFGTSTVRLLRPGLLDRELGGRFANLAINSGTAYEQSRLLELFARSHGAIRTVIVGIDNVWCDIGAAPPRYTFREFPEWMYDENPWNDLLHLYNLKTLEVLGRQVAYLAGLRPPKYGRDGYAVFLPPDSRYDLARARRNLYGGDGTPRPPAPGGPPPSAAERAAWTYPAHPTLAAMLRRLPAATRKVLLFVPYHVTRQGAPGSRTFAQWQECKRRLVALASEVGNADVLDFMIPSEITRRDGNYWDGQHYRVAVADRLPALIAEGLRTRRGRADLFRYLGPSRPPAAARLRDADAEAHLVGPRTRPPLPDPG